MATTPQNKPFRQWTRLQQGHGSRASRLPGNNHLGGISTDLCDVPLNPLQALNLIQISIVSGLMTGRFLGQFRVRHESEGADAVVEVHKDCVLPGDIRSIAKSHATEADCRTTAVQEVNHGKDRALPDGRGRPKIQVQSIFAASLFSEIVIDIVGAKNLNALWHLAVRVINTLPGSTGCGSRQRHSRTGDAANGMPRYAFTLEQASCRQRGHYRSPRDRLARASPSNASCCFCSASYGVRTVKALFFSAFQ
jgi:hypothetical protein